MTQNFAKLVWWICKAAANPAILELQLSKREVYGKQHHHWPLQPKETKNSQTWSSRKDLIVDRGKANINRLNAGVHDIKKIKDSERLIDFYLARHQQSWPNRPIETSSDDEDNLRLKPRSGYEWAEICVQSDTNAHGNTTRQRGLASPSNNC